MGQNSESDGEACPGGRQKITNCTHTHINKNKKNKQNQKDIPSFEMNAISEQEKKN